MLHHSKNLNPNQMTGKQENILNMYRVTDHVLTDNTPVWTAVTAFASGYAAFQSSVTDIQTTRTQQETDLRGIAQDKLNKKGVLIVAALKVAQPMVAYANVINNPQLRQ